MSARKEPTLAHHLGAFVGHVVGAIRTPVSSSRAIDVNTTVLEHTTPEGVTLRRTVRDQVVLPDPGGSGTPPAVSSGEVSPEHSPRTTVPGSCSAGGCGGFRR